MKTEIMEIVMKNLFDVSDDKLCSFISRMPKGVYFENRRLTYCDGIVVLLDGTVCPVFHRTRKCFLVPLYMDRNNNVHVRPGHHRATIDAGIFYPGKFEESIIRYNKEILNKEKTIAGWYEF